MKIQFISLLVSMLVLLAACAATPAAQTSAPTSTVVVPAATPNIEATVQAKVSLTEVAKATAVPTATVAATTDAQKLHQAVKVEMVDMKLVLKDTAAGRFSDEEDFVYQFTNTGTVGIRALTGVYTLTDLFGHFIRRASITYSEPIAPGQAVTDANFYKELNPFIAEDQLLGATSYKNTKFVFEPTSVIFEDGTTLGSTSK